MMLHGPIPATQKVLARAGLKRDDIDLVEINEAFASVPLAWSKELGWDLAKVNVNGGASAISINGSTFGAFGDNFQRQSPGYNAATSRFDIEISGGASHVDFRTG